jgi:hypothetical protein
MISFYFLIFLNYPIFFKGYQSYKNYLYIISYKYKTSKNMHTIKHLSTTLPYHLILQIYRHNHIVT